MLINSKEISASRWKTVLYLAGSLAFVAIAVLLLQHRDRDADKLQLGLVFFGLCAIAFGWRLIRPQRLVLDAEGFALQGGFVRSPKKVLWRDIDAFFVYRLPRGGEMIGFKYKPGARELSPTVRLTPRLGADGALPKGWPQPPERMVEELNSWRLRAQVGDAG